MDTNTRKVKRGEIYYYDFGDNEGSIQNGVRPVLVVQCRGGQPGQYDHCHCGDYIGNQEALSALPYHFGQTGSG